MERKEYFEILADKIVWSAIHATKNGTIKHRCDGCPCPLDVPNPVYEGKFICRGNCKDYGFPETISVNEAKRQIIETLDKRT